MGVLICFLLFLSAVVLCLARGWTLIVAVWCGIVLFGLLGLRRGHVRHSL